MRVGRALVFLLAFVLATSADHALALRAARPYALTLVAPRGASDASSDSPISSAPSPAGRRTLSVDGAVVVTARPVSARGGNRDPNAVRLTSSAGVAIRARVEEIAPDLHRIVPARRLPRGTLRVSGIPGVTSLRVVAAVPATAGAPAIERVTNHRTPMDPSQPAGAATERVIVTLREPPPETAVALVTRWVDWHDTEGGLYGAWMAIPAGASRELTLICTAELGCPGNGHIPRENERGELRWVDANGRLSDTVTITVTTSR